MHAEDRGAQEEGMRLYEEAFASEPAESLFKGALSNNLDFMRRHYVIIERFGRFPHRNGILGRPPTAGEAHFLANDGETFGVRSQEGKTAKRAETSPHHKI